jgi:hypothetical protein
MYVDGGSLSLVQVDGTKSIGWGAAFYPQKFVYIPTSYATYISQPTLYVVYSYIYMRIYSVTPVVYVV